MEEKLKNHFEKLLGEKTSVNGVIRMTQFSQDLNENVVMVEVEGHPVFITSKELDVKPVKSSLADKVGETLTFQIVEITEEGIILGSARQIKEDMLDALAASLEEGKSYKAKITKILPYGAYLDIHGLSVQLLNRDFSEDYTTIKDVLKEGDSLEVVHKKYTDNRNLRVEAKVKHVNKSAMSFDTLAPNQVVLGSVRNVKPWGVFVCIAPNIDALCPAPATMDVREGDKVTFKITQVREQDQRVRGKILKINE